VLRIALVVVTCLGLSCKRRASKTEEVPGWKAAAVVPVDASASEDASVQMAQAHPERTQPPSDDEIRAAFKPVFDAHALGACLTAASPPKDRTTFELRVAVQPSGQVSSARIVDVADADGCVLNAFAQVQLTPWYGGGTIVSIPVARSGDPVPAPRKPGVD
jgi:hypothetical protein